MCVKLHAIGVKSHLLALKCDVLEAAEPRLLALECNMCVKLHAIGVKSHLLALKCDVLEEAKPRLLHALVVGVLRQRPRCHLSNQPTNQINRPTL
jgi:hypothetical protein